MKKFYKKGGILVIALAVLTSGIFLFSACAGGILAPFVLRLLKKSEIEHYKELALQSEALAEIENFYFDRYDKDESKFEAYKINGVLYFIQQEFEADEVTFYNGNTLYKYGYGAQTESAVEKSAEEFPYENDAQTMVDELLRYVAENEPSFAMGITARFPEKVPMGYDISLDYEKIDVSIMGNTVKSFSFDFSFDQEEKFEEARFYVKIAQSEEKERVMIIEVLQESAIERYDSVGERFAENYERYKRNGFTHDESGWYIKNDYFEDFDDFDEQE